VMRVPRTQGLPKRTSGVIVMRSKELMRQVYGNHLAASKRRFGSVSSGFIGPTPFTMPS